MRSVIRCVSAAVFAVIIACTGAYIPASASPAHTSGTDLAAASSSSFISATPRATAQGLTVSPATQIGQGWKPQTTFSLGDFNGDGRPDLGLIVPNGQLRMYARTSTTRFATPRTIGQGWSPYTVLGTSDWNSDLAPDIIAFDSAGRLFAYLGNGRGAFQGRVQIGQGWKGFSSVTLVSASVGQRTRILATTSAGVTRQYVSNGKGSWLDPVTVKPPVSTANAISWPGNAKGSTLSVLAATGNKLSALMVNDRQWSVDSTATLPLSNARLVDVQGTSAGATLTVVTSTGTLHTVTVSLRAEKPAPTPPPVPEAPAGPRTATPVASTVASVSSAQRGVGWPASGAVHMGDFNRDGFDDLGLIMSNGEFYAYYGTATGGFSGRTLIGVGWSGLSFVQGGVDVTGDGTPDVIACTPNGELVVYTGKGDGRFGARIQIGHGWTQAQSILLLRNGPNGNPAVLFTRTNGRTFLYQMNGRSGFTGTVELSSSDSRIGTALRSDDWNKDGRSDLLLRGSDGSLNVLFQSPSGEFDTLARIGQGWNGMRSIISADVTATSNRIYAIDGSGRLYAYDFRSNATPRGFVPTPPALAAPNQPSTPTNPAAPSTPSTPNAPSTQYKGHTFAAGNIISDAEFFTSGTMSVQEIRDFLASKNPNCRPGADGAACLKDYRTTTTQMDTAYCAPYTPGTNEDAATIISKSATACSINPKVLIVLLQKEQGLVTASGPSLNMTRYTKATGFRCPDGAPCDPTYAGLASQVYYAASRYVEYGARPEAFRFRAGGTYSIAYTTNAACGTTQVTIANRATAALYNYTPYVPNAAALANITGTGNSCSSYGNRNFWRNYIDWFGSTGV
ncbi:VCBS repeat-containing protein [Schaalia sp. ZJ1691]|uniref:FG-GAP repeat domain-containing protein n=1 Tax=Schaalia sp. ZJ1691 TaxID=2709404 RepID=UPI0013EDB26A|nr:VCBS repeat-containing protein [Schaalia sp. ZJ1691]